jgi:hypothetical protein
MERLHEGGIQKMICTYESLTAEREQVRKIHNTEEYQDGKNSYCEFFGLVPLLQLAIHMLSEEMDTG